MPEIFCKYKSVDSLVVLMTVTEYQGSPSRAFSHQCPHEGDFAARLLLLRGQSSLPYRLNSDGYSQLAPELPPPPEFIQ